MKKALEVAYQAHITKLYKVLSQAILAANGDEQEIDAAEQRSRKGLAHAADVRKRARKVTGLELIYLTNKDITRESTRTLPPVFATLKGC